MFFFQQSKVFLVFKILEIVAKENDKGSLKMRFIVTKKEVFKMVFTNTPLKEIKRSKKSL